MGLRPFISDFVTFWVVIDPFAALPVFLALTAHCAPDERRKIAVQTILVAAVVIGFFIVFGQIIIEAIGLSIRAFQIAGGVVLFLFAVSLVLGDGEGRTRSESEGKRGFELAITLGMLFAAGPITRAIGAGGANVLRRIMGMILASVAVNTVLGGLGSWLGLPKL